MYHIPVHDAGLPWINHAHIPREKLSRLAYLVEEDPLGRRTEVR